MLLNLLCITLACLSAWFYLRWTRVRSYWAERKVPHLPPHPLWGSLTCLQQINMLAQIDPYEGASIRRRSIRKPSRVPLSNSFIGIAVAEFIVERDVGDVLGIWMKQMYARFSAPYIGIWLFWRPALIINDPDIGKRILIKDSEFFRDRFLSSGKNDPIGSLNIFTVNDPLWTSIRRRLTPILTSSKLRSLHGLVLGKSKQLLQRIEKETKAGIKINLRMMFSDFSTDVIGISSFGVDSDATTTGTSHIRTVSKDFMKFNLYRGVAWSCIFFFPELVNVFGFTFFPKKATNYLRKVFNEVARQRRLEGSDRKDLVDALLKIQDDAKENKEDISDDTIIAQAAIFLQGGFDTTGNFLTFAAYELAHHPEAQEKLYNEIRKLKERIGDKEFHIDDLANLMYMSAVINEVLRKYPAMGFLDRVAAKDYAIDNNLTISAGTPVYVNAIGMHYDPKYFPEPESFNPDRFLPENSGNIKPETFLPFGEGPRVCIGQRFAYLNIRYALASLFYKFELRPLPGAPQPNACAIETNALFYIPAEIMSVKFIPRNKQLEF